MANVKVISDSVRSLKEAKKMLEEKLKSCNDAIAGMQAMCDHEWIYRGHGHNFDRYQCEICEKTEER